MEASLYKTTHVNGQDTECNFEKDEEWPGLPTAAYKRLNIKAILAAVAKKGLLSRWVLQTWET